MANFEKNVYEPDVTLKERIVRGELPALIYKCVKYYKKMVEENPGKGIWQICPEYFIFQQEEVKMERNPLYKYLTDNTRYKEGSILRIEEIRTAFNNWLGKKVTKLDHGTFGQVNREYVIEAIQTCKHCGKEHKKGCCEEYSSKGRTIKKIVKNIEFNDDDDNVL